MRYSLISAALALASSVLAQNATPGFDAISAPTQDQNVAAGSTMNIVWDPANYTGTVTITLLEGESPTKLSLGPVVKAGIDNTVGKFSWAVPTTLGSFATYGFSISLDADPKTFQYSFPFHITGLSGSSSGSASASGGSSVTYGSTYPASGASTTTVKIATGTGYSASSSPTTVVVTSVKSNGTTTATVGPKSTGSASNATLATTAKPSASKTSAGSSSSSTSSGAPTQSSSAAVGNMVSGGFAVIGGLVLALVL